MKTHLLCALAAGTLLASAAEFTVPIEKYELKNGLRVILSQAMISAAIGFVVGGVLAFGMQAAMAKANLSVALFPELYAATLVVTIAMCSFAALLSIVKVLRLDPASVFKG